jgi:hypothetical protein
MLCGHHKNSTGTYRIEFKVKKALTGYINTERIIPVNRTILVKYVNSGAFLYGRLEPRYLWEAWIVAIILGPTVHTE